MKKGAFFDVDATKFRKHLSGLWAHKMIEERVVAPAHGASVTRAYKNYLLRTGTFEEYDKALIEFYYGGTALKGVRLDVVQRLAVQVVKEHGGRIHIFPRAVLNAARRCGYIPVLISGSPNVIVSEFAKLHQLEYWRGTDLPHKDGILTGESNGANAYNKGPLLNSIARELGISLKDSLAIGDGVADAKMLECVGYPIMFNPSPALSAIDKKEERRWGMIKEIRSIMAFMYAGNIRIEADVRQLLPLDIGPIVKAELEALGVLG
jgi:phosphoserine phosphatase